MSRQSMVERAASLPRAAKAGIGRFRDRDGTAVDFDLGWDDIERDTRWVGQLLDDWGLRGGQSALFTMAGHEAPWLGPVLRAVRARHVTIATAEVHGWDAGRSAMFAQLLRPHVLVGLSAATYQGLDDEGRELVAQIPVVFCRPDAHAAAAGGLDPALMQFVGPALAVECPQRSGAHLDPAEWNVAADGAGVLLDTVGARAFRPAGLYLNVGCDVVTGPCPCGRTGPRLVLR